VGVNDYSYGQKQWSYGKYVFRATQINGRDKREYSRKLKLLTVLIKENELEDKARDEIRIQMKIPLESL
jgi:hypothetical protein